MKTFERGVKRLRSDLAVVDDKWEMAVLSSDDEGAPVHASMKGTNEADERPKRGSGRLCRMQAEEAPLMPKKPELTKTSPTTKPAVAATEPKSNGPSDSLNSSQPRPHDISDSDSPLLLLPRQPQFKARRRQEVVAIDDEIFEPVTNLDPNPVPSSATEAAQAAEQPEPEVQPPQTSYQAVRPSPVAPSSHDSLVPINGSVSISPPDKARIEPPPQPQSVQHLQTLPPLAPSIFGRSQTTAQRNPQPHLMEPSPAQTIAEAQERGEQQEIQDDASYALDGLSPSSSLPSQRESTSKLSQLLSSRRGRAALRPDGLAQQVLTAAAKLRGSHDPSLALSCASILYSLSSKDAHPSFLASSAAAVLIAQLLQCTEHDLSPHISARAPFELSCARTVEERAAVSRALAVVVEGQAGKKLSSDLLSPPPPSSMLSEYQGAFPSIMLGSHLPLVLLAVQSVTNTEASTLKFTDRIKINLFKVKALDHLAAIVGRKCRDLELVFSSKQNDKAMDEMEIEAPQESPLVHDLPPPAPQSKLVEHGPTNSEPTGGEGGLKSDPWELPGEEEDEQDPPGNRCNTTTIDHPPDNMELKAVNPETIDGEEVEEEEVGPSGTTESSSHALYWRARRQMSELRICLSVIENATFTSPENEEAMLKIIVKDGDQITVPSESSVSQVADEVLGENVDHPEGGGRGKGFVQILVKVLQLLSPYLTSPPPSSLSILHDPTIDPPRHHLFDLEACIHSCLGVLMNLTHQHEEGVQACIQAGALQATAEIIWCCSLKGSSSKWQGPSSPSSTTAEPDREAMLKKLDLLTVASGLLINLVSDSAANRELLRLSTFESVGTVHLLCRIFTVMAAPAETKSKAPPKTKPKSVPKRAPSADDPFALDADDQDLFLPPPEEEEDHDDEVTADDLHGKHQEGEAAIIQAYSAMLLGFLIVDSPEARLEARRELGTLAAAEGHGDGLIPVASAVKRCLEFYTMTGAITERCSSSLTGLLSGLNEEIVANK